LGARVRTIHDQPTGSNINDNAGSLYPQQVAGLVRESSADVGFSFDGDGDRVICCDERGSIRDGDYMLAIASRFMKDCGCLKANTVVATSMSNFGLEKFLESHKIRLLRADVGDKYVLEQMRSCGSNLGGEQSGHIIFLDYATTGDGLLTAVQLLRIMRTSGAKLSRLARGMKKYPQILLNTRVRQRRPFSEMPPVQARIKNVQRQLAGNGRLVVRYSGTELLARVMVEGQRKSVISHLARSIITAIDQEIGVHA
jgi:phosphoglucosamine mutase